MVEIAQLCEVIKALTPEGALTLQSKRSDTNDQWRGMVTVGGVILVESVGTINEVIVDLSKKMRSLSQRMLAKFQTKE